MYDIKFNVNNPNCIIVKESGKVINYIACPPIKEGCDVINFEKKPLQVGYTYNFDGLAIITDETKREIYYKGKLIDKINRI